MMESRVTKVAIVEDLREIREGLGRLINATPGHRCTGIYASMEEALEKIPHNLPDLVLSDIGLPGMDGINGIRLLKERYPSLTILMLTVYDDNERIFDALCAGACGYLLKKTPSAKLIEALKEAVEGGSPMSPEVARRVITLFRPLTPDVDSGFRLRQPTDGQPLAAIVTPPLAAAAGKDRLLPFEIAGERVVLRVAGVAKRFPGTTEPDFAVVDEGALSTALNALVPGLGARSETWLNVPSGERSAAAARLARPPYDQLEVRSQAALEAQLRDDPLARGVLLVLAGTALVALGLAAVGLVLGLLSDVRDERGELFDLESQGAAPSLLRRHLRLRTLLLAAVGAAGGIATGAVLCALVLDLVRLTAGAAIAQPPLVLVLDWPLVLAGAGVWVAVTAVAVAVGTRAGFRSRAAGRIVEAGA